MKPIGLSTLIDNHIVDICGKGNESLKIYDLHFFRKEELVETVFSSYQLAPILAFAKNRAGDFWGFAEGELIAIYRHDDEESELIAPDVNALLFQQVVNMAAHVRIQDSAQELVIRNRISSAVETLSSIFNKMMTGALIDIGSRKAVESPFGRTLIGEKAAYDIIDTVCLFAQRNETFPWMKT